MDFLLLSAIWGASFLLLRVATPEFGPLALIGLRSGLAALCLLPLLWLREGRDGWANVAAHAGPMAVLGVTNALLPFTLLAYATLSLSAGFTALINASTPLWAAIVGLVWLRAGLSAAQWLGLALGVVGMVILTWGKVDFRPGGSGLAVVAGLVATLAYGFSTHFAKRKVTAVSPLGVAAGSQTTGALMLLPFVLTYWPATTPSATAWIAAVLLAVLATAFALIIYFRLIARLGGQKAATVTFLIPVFAIAWGAVFLGEGVTGLMLAGGAVVLAGTGLTLGWSGSAALRPGKFRQSP